MIQLHTLQLIAAEWHRARYPNDGPVHVALNINEEAGEVAKAVRILLDPENNMDCLAGEGTTADICNHAVDEAADVVIGAMVLVGRYIPPSTSIRTLQEAIEAKLTKLSNEEGGHRGSIQLKEITTQLECGCVQIGLPKFKKVCPEHRS